MTLTADPAADLPRRLLACGAGLLIAASMHAGVVLLAGVSVREAGGEACGDACDHGEEDEGDQCGEEAPPGPSAPAAVAAPSSHSP